MIPPVAILAGGLGTRLSEETDIKPKPMVEIGGQPILWHIMKIYAHYGFKEFIIALGYKGDYIKDYFMQNKPPHDWRVHLLDTGEATQISGRVRRILQFTCTTTMLTYGDGLADVNVAKLFKFHQAHQGMMTITAVRPPSRFGRVWFAEDKVTICNFDEKPLSAGEEFINGGFMVADPKMLLEFDLGDDEIFERVYLPRLASRRQLVGYVHNGFWQCMDTIREKQLLNEMWATGDAKWKVWND